MAGIFAKYRNYSHAVGEAGIAITRDTKFSADGIEEHVTTRWDYTGVLIAADQATLITEIRALESAYEQHGGEAYIMDDTNILHSLKSSQAIGGVRVVRKPSFTEFVGAEGQTQRTYNLALEADIITAASDAGSGIVEWEETLSFSGGGPRWVYLPVLNGQPQKQTTHQATTYKAVQSGRAVGLSGYPTVPRPIWPQALHQDQSGSQISSPVKVGSGAAATSRRYPVSWTYVFESTEPLIGTPTARR